MPAFQYAVDHGYRYVETDVQVTNDGVLVAFHDNDLSRTCGRDARISELPWSQVRTALVDGKAPIPLLEEMLGAWPELRVQGLGDDQQGASFSDGGSAEVAFASDVVPVVPEIVQAETGPSESRRPTNRGCVGVGSPCSG